MASRRRGPIVAYRIADIRYPIFDGRGAALHGGRWNSAGRRVIYAAETYAGALLEMLVHTNIGRMPKTQRYIEIQVPENVEIEEASLQEIAGWDAPDQRASRRYGDHWYDSRRTAVLLVPSVVTRVERNVLINQDHPHFNRISASRARPIHWDARLFKRQRMPDLQTAAAP